MALFINERPGETCVGLLLDLQRNPGTFPLWCLHLKTQMFRFRGFDLSLAWLSVCVFISFL